MEHQDWTSITIGKPKVEEKKTTTTYTQPKLKYDDDGQEIITLNKLTDYKDYMKLRDALKLTRVQVAQMLSVKPNIINDIENGKIVDKATVGRYKNLLKSQSRKLGK